MVTIYTKKWLLDLIDASHASLGPYVELVGYIDELTTLQRQTREKPRTFSFLSQLKKVTKGLIDTSTCIDQDNALDTVTNVSHVAYDKKQQLFQKVKTESDTQQTLYEDFKDDLIKFYRKQHSTLPMSPILEKGQEAALIELYTHPIIKLKHLDKEDQQLDKDIASFHEIFNSGEKECRNIYLTSPAGNGKTSFVKYMTLIWCQSQIPEEGLTASSDDLDVLEKFEYLFFLSLKDSMTKECDIRKMIDSQIIQSMEHAYTYSYEFVERCIRERRCLIILDGLDEWFPNSECRICAETQIPHIKMQNSCTYFTTCSPSKLGSLQRNKVPIDKLLDLEGLDEDSSNTLVKNIISHLKSIFVEQKDDLAGADGDVSVHSKSVNVILMNLLSLWFDGEPSSSRLCEIYCYMLELLFTRNAHKLQIYQQLGMAIRANTSFQLPTAFKTYFYCTRHSNVLHTYGKIAFETMFSTNHSGTYPYCFSRSEMEKYISKDTINIGLDIGIICIQQNEPRQMYFLHRTYQEFLAALYISCDSDTGLNVSYILETCDTADECFKLSKFFMFVKEMDDTRRVYHQMVSAIKQKFSMLPSASWRSLATALHISEDKRKDTIYSESTTDEQITTTGAMYTALMRKRKHAFRQRLIQHYRERSILPKVDDTLQHLKSKLNIKLFPNFKPASEKDIPDDRSSRLHQTLPSFIQSMYLKSSKSKRLFISSGKHGAIDEAYEDLLNAWVDSVENDDDVDSAEYDVVLAFQRRQQCEYYTDFDEFVRCNLADELGCSLEDSILELSCCKKCLVLLDGSSLKFSPILPVESPYHVIYFTEEGVQQLHACDAMDMFVASNDRNVAIALKKSAVLTGNDVCEFEEWINSRLKTSESSKHTVCFVDMRTDTETCVHLTPLAQTEVIELHNCDISFSVSHEAETLLLYGTSIVGLDRCLENSHKLASICLYFEDSQNGNMCNPLTAKTFENITASVEICLHLQKIELKGVSIGSHKHITCCLSRSEIERVKSNDFVSSTSTICSCLLGPCLEKLNFDKIDFDLERTQFVKRLIMHALCHRLVTSNEIILEAYASEQEDGTMGIVCFTKAGSHEALDFQTYGGFPVFQKHHNSVSTESIIAEADTKGLENDSNMYQKDVCSTIEHNVEHLFREHSNLEAVCGSFVQSTCSGIKKSAPCIVLYCRWKGMIPYGEKEFPAQLNDRTGKTNFVTDVREGFFVFGPNGTSLTGGATDWNKELAMGCSIGPNQGTYSATLGPFINVCGSDRTCFLTVRHMFQPFSIEDLRLRGTKIVQPADGDELVSTHGTRNSKSPEERVCGEVLVSHFDERVDAAVIEIIRSRIPSRGNFVSVTKDALHFAGFSQSNFPTFDDGKMMDATILTVADHATDRIIKFGRQTGLTRGSLDLQDMAVKIKDDSKLSIHYNGRMHDHVMKQQLKIKSYSADPFFLRGDSGSAVFLVEKNNTLHCIAMAIGLLTDHTCVATPIQTVLESLNKVSPQGLKFELKKFDFDQMHT